MNKEGIKEVLLISGSAEIGTYKNMDMKNTIYDEHEGHNLISKYYRIQDKTYIPEKAFININNIKYPLLRYNRSKHPPLVTRTLETILEKGGIKYKSIECNEIWKNNVYEKKYLCKIVCLSTTFMWSENMIDKAIKWIKNNVKFEYIVLGGHYSSVKYEYILNTYREVNYVIVGDGEIALPKLINSLLNYRTDVSDVPNLAYLCENEIIKNYAVYEDLDKIDRVEYDGDYKWLSYESVRGCAYGCAFCTWDAGIKKFRYKSPEKILEDFHAYKKANNVKRIEIIDSTFLFPFERIEPILKGMKKLGLHWKAHARSDVPYTKKMVKQLEESNCDILQIGFEAMTDRILKNMRKHTTVVQNRRTNELFKTSKIDTVVSFIVGFPDETKEEFLETKDYILNEHWGHFYIFVFEMEDKSLDLWKNRKEFGLELYEDKEDCVHGGANWKHNGMTSEAAFELRSQLLKDVRKNNSKAIYKSWQSPYEWPFIPMLDKETNLNIERLLDNLVFATVDCELENIGAYILDVVEELKRYGVEFDE